MILTVAAMAATAILLLFAAAACTGFQEEALGYI